MLPTTEPEIDAFLHAFESCTLPKAQWTHSAHIFTGACYVHLYGESEAIRRIRTNIRRYNESVGGQNTETAGYHETVTLFWIKLLAGLRREHPDESRAEFAALAVACFAHDHDVLARHYDFDVIRSTDARRAWQSPTLRPDGYPALAE
jgi:hypothetical protein